MPTSSVGRTSSARRRGVTLLELLIVMGIIAIMAGVSFPSMSAGLDSIRLKSASDSLVSFLNSAVTRADRRQQAVLLTILPKQNRLEVCTNEPGFTRELKLPDGVSIEAVLPREADIADGEPRRLILLPGAAAPGIGIQIVNRRGARRVVRVDPMTGFPRVESVVKE